MLLSLLTKTLTQVIKMNIELSLKQRDILKDMIRRFHADSKEFQEETMVNMPNHYDSDSIKKEESYRKELETIITKLN